MGEKIKLAEFSNDTQIRIKDIKDYLSIINSNSEIVYNLSTRYKKERIKIIEDIINDIQEMSNPYRRDILLKKWNTVLDLIKNEDVYKPIK